MKHHHFFKCLATLLIAFNSWVVHSQNLELVTGELFEGDIVVIKEVKLGYAISDGNQANLIEDTGNEINIQFLVEGNSTDGYQFLVENTANGLKDDRTGELYLHAGTNVWDVFIKSYEEGKCTWFLVESEEPGVFKLKSQVEKGNNFVGVNYRDVEAGFPLWRDKASFPYSDPEEWTDYGIFWQLFRYSLYDYYSLKLNKLVVQAFGYNYSEDYLPIADARDISKLAYEADALRKSPDATEEQLRDKAEELFLLLLEGDSAALAYNELLLLIEDVYNNVLELPYPSNAKEQLTNAANAAILLFSTEDARRKEFEAMILELNGEVRNFYFAGLSTAGTDSPVNSTWMLTNPDFEWGNSSGWETNGFNIKNTAQDFSNFQGTYFVERYTSPTGTLGDYYIQQTVPESVPNGLYKITAEIVACNQNADSINLADGTGIRGVNLYANSTSMSVGTENGSNPGPDDKPKGGDVFTMEFVVTNNQLTVGFETRSTNANWVGIDHIQLTYSGVGSLQNYEQTYSEQLAKAKELLQEVMLVPDYNYLEQTIRTAESADRSQIEALSATINSINTAIDRAKESIKGLKDFKAGSYNTLLETEFSTEELEKKIESTLASCDLILQNDTTTAAVYPALESELAAYVEFVDEFNRTFNFSLKTEVFSSESIDEFVMSLHTIVARMEPLKAGQLEELTEALWTALTTLRNVTTEVGDLTQIWLINPSFDDESDKNRATSGWLNEGDFSVNTAQVIADENFDGTYCMEKWVGYGNVLPDLSLSQTINGLPNGRYTLTVKAKALQQQNLDTRRQHVSGVYLFANTDSTEISTPMLVDKDNCELDPETGDTLVYAYFNSVNAPHHTEPQAETFSVSFEVKNYELTLGFATKDATANWVCFDTFTLHCEEIYSFVGVKEITSQSSELIVYTENRYVKVVGTEDFEIRTLSGIQIPSSTQLLPGIYIVKAGNQATKIAVK